MDSAHAPTFAVIALFYALNDLYLFFLANPDFWPCKYLFGTFPGRQANIFASLKQVQRNLDKVTISGPKQRCLGARVNHYKNIKKNKVGLQKGVDFKRISLYIIVSLFIFSFFVIVLGTVKLDGQWKLVHVEIKKKPLKTTELFLNQNVL